MSQPEARSPASPLLDAAVRRLAGATLFLWPGDAFLVDVTRGLVGDAVQNPETLADALIREGDRIRERIVGRDASDDPSCRVLRYLAAAGNLSYFELELLLVALLPELDERYGDVLQAMRGGTGARRPTLGLATRLLMGDDVDRGNLRELLERSALWSAAMLRPTPVDTPLFDRLLEPTAAVRSGIESRLPERLSAGGTVRWLDPQDGELSETLALRPAINEQARGLVRWLRGIPDGVLHLRSSELEPARELAAACAAAVGKAVVWVDDASADAVCEATLAAALQDAVCAVHFKGSTERLAVPAQRHQVPLVVVTAPECALDVPSSVPSRAVTPRRPRPLDQLLVWQRYLHTSGGTARVDVLANQTRLTVPMIRRTVDLATQQARSEGRKGAIHRDVTRALDEVAGWPSTPLARTSRPRVNWSRVVLPRRQRSQLEDLVRRIQHRVTVQDRWQMGGPSQRGRGLMALLHGPSGTGKTLACDAVATQLSLPVLSVDLSRVVSKFIGETEKHLASLFDAAEGFGALLFFDEADALFGKRTSVKDAHDRYANIETNYLLQRLESFDGIALLATNLMQNMDDAFTRRLQFVVHFPRPNKIMQRLIWQQHLPSERVAEDVDFDALATSFDLVGGEIRNVALAAAYAAAAKKSPITQALLVAAVREELIKKGRTFHESEGASHAH